ncbi:MAG: CopG family transcriptional regulator [Bacilli bacterium]|nr:CopG family transcriptional regulator [Bacilli bacterium]
MKSDRITIRINEDLKKELNVLADKYKMNLSQFVSMAINEKLETDKLSDSQLQFIQLFETAFKQSYDPFFKQMMVVLNRCDFNTRWAIKQQDIFMGQLKIPQTRDGLTLSIIDHPVTEVAHEKVEKDIRKMSSRKNELDNE